ncbi:hypothetical protein ACJMK2_000245 [Sinanodonta woodiana]|uniref:Cas1p 10 TM acyl transferase domain-containing protein n=1 Tax=Sinanodonta woodiana TaxID=1069815 RepID=A0ABD3XNT2_SINWO
MNLTDNKMYDDHTRPHYDVTSGQLTIFAAWGIAFAVWLFRKQEFSFSIGLLTKNEIPNLNKKVQNSFEENKVSENSRMTSVENVADGTKSHQVEIDSDHNHDNGQSKRETKQRAPPTLQPTSPTFDQFLKYLIMFGIVMMYFFLCDYKKVFPLMERKYDKDTFLFLIFLFFLVACGFTIKPTTDKILNREQTEEWKGWMQVMFVWYHVFAAMSWYNWIRVYIAAYVWLTGFGNFSFFWVRKDYSLWRVLKMLFRLNFLVICICAVVNNEYMLYYICAMHTYWFLSVYLFMAILKSWNTERTKMAVKFAVYVIINFVIFEIPVVTMNIFRPLWFILQFHDGKFEPMHEWAFRAGLDHWACLAGMLCAYNYPHFEALIKYMESTGDHSRRSQIIRISLKLLLVTSAILALVVWYVTFMVKEKYDYNKTHPYSSIIPILAFIVLRNSFPILRQYYVHMFGFLGKITLETVCYSVSKQDRKFGVSSLYQNTISTAIVNYRSGMA